MRAILLFLWVLISFSTFSQSPPNYRKTSSLKSSGQQGLGAANNAINIEVFGSGGIQGSTTESTNQSNLGSGAVGVVMHNNNLQASLSFTLNTSSTIDFTGTESFGSALLVPGVGTNTFIADIKGFQAFKQRYLGYSIYAFASNTKWKRNDSTFNSNPLAIKALVSFVPINNFDNVGASNHIMISIEAGYTGRFLMGEITDDKNFMKTTFGTDRTIYHGIELDFNLWINDTKLFVNIPFVGGEKVKGLTGGQLVIGAALSGKLFKSKL